MSFFDVVSVKTLQALVAFIWPKFNYYTWRSFLLYFEMTLDVIVSIASIEEFFATELTRVGFLTIVHSYVKLESLLLVSCKGTVLSWAQNIRGFPLVMNLNMNTDSLPATEST